MISISGSKRIKPKEREKPKSSPLKGEILSLKGIITVDPGEFANQSSRANAQVVNSVFKEPVYQILEKIKNEPYFKWPNKMEGDPSKRNQNLYCQYHQDRGHTTKDCRTLCDHLDQLVKDGKLKQFIHQLSGQASQTGAGYQREIATRPSLGTINVIFATPSRDAGSCLGIMFVASKPVLEEQVRESKRVSFKHC